MRNIRTGGVWNPSVMTCLDEASALPERRKNGTPCQRQFSISARTAIIVSVSESLGTPSIDR